MAAEKTMGEVMYRTVIVMAKSHQDNYKALDMAKERDIYQGSCTGIGLSKITLLCTEGEAGTYGYDLRWKHGVENHVITGNDIPHRPDNWPEPSYRYNWEKVGSHRCKNCGGSVPDGGSLCGLCQEREEAYARQM